MKIIGIIMFGILMNLLSCNQTELLECEKNDNSISVLAELISDEGGSKIQFLKYKIIKIIDGQISNDTIQVGYYFYNELELMPKTAILTLEEYNGSSNIQDYYVFPNYNPKEGIEKVNISTIDFDYWEGCETGEKECLPLELIREFKNKKWFLIMPCGGTNTTIYLSEKEGIPIDDEVIQKKEISYSQCPPIFEITKLKDGKYYVYMISCGLGGQIEINLNSSEK